MKSFVLSLAFMMRFKASRKWPIVNSPIVIYIHDFALIRSVIGNFQIAVILIMKARLSAKAFHMKISFVCI